MKNIKELRENLTQLYTDLKTGEFKGSDAKEMNNCAGKIINSIKVQLEYSSLRKEKPEIKFLEVD